MPLVYDVIQLNPGTSWISDGSTYNDITQSDISIIDPVAAVDNDGDNSLSIGDTFNGSNIVQIGKFGGQVTYDYGSSSARSSGMFASTSDGNTYLIYPDGTSFEGITDLHVIAEAGRGTLPYKAISADEKTTVACFCSGTRILTPSGERAIETLQVGQRVTTLDHGPQPIRFIWRSAHKFPGAERQNLPIQFKAGSLGPNSPKRDLTVSPQHRMLLNCSEFRKSYGNEEILVPAKGLLKLAGVRVKQGTRTVEYLHLLFDRHEILLANGTMSESFFPGAAVLCDMQPDDREALFAVNPGLRTGAEEGLGSPARPILHVQETIELANHRKQLLRDEIAKWDVDLSLERNALRPNYCRAPCPQLQQRIAK